LSGTTDIFYFLFNLFINLSPKIDWKETFIYLFSAVGKEEEISINWMEI